MGIGVALGIGSIASGLLGNKSAKQAANAQVQGADKATQAQLQMFNKQLELMQPYSQAGQSALPGLAGLVGQQQQSFQGMGPFSFDYSGYMRGPEYAAMQAQAEDAALRNQSAVGGLRSGGSQVALASIAPQLAQQGRQNALNEYNVNQANRVNEYSLNQAALMDQYNRQMGLAGLGLGSAQQSASAAGQFGQQAGNNAMTAGNALANKYNQYGQNTQGMLGDLSSIGVKMFGGF
jgi:hypothetical protein